MLGGRRGAEADARSLLRERYGARRVVLVDSGTSALTLALIAAREAGGEAGGAVACPAFSCFDVGTAWMGAGATPLLYDVEPETLSPDPGSLREAVDEGAGAVVLAHLYGIPIHWNRVERALEGSGALVVEDAAQGVGCRWRGEPAGALGDLSVLSFGRGKGWTAGGGGALLALTERGEAALGRVDTDSFRRSGSLGPLLRAVAQWLFGRPSLYGLPARAPFLTLGETVYHPPARVSGISTFSLGALPVTARLAKEAASVRRERAERLLTHVRATDGLVAVEPPRRGTPGYLRLPLLAAPVPARRLAGVRAARLGVTRSYPRPLHRVDALRRSFTDRRRDLAGAERLSEALFTIPTHGMFTDREVRRLEDLLRGDSPDSA